MKRMLGLHWLEDEFVYQTKGCFFTQKGIRESAELLGIPFECNTDGRLFTSNGVLDLYEAILAVPEADSRSLCLTAALAAGWCSVFAERLKSLSFQIPAFAFEGPAQCGKSTFVTKNSLLRPSAGTAMLVSTSMKKKERQERINSCRYGQLVVSDIHAETTGTYGKTAVLLDETVRPAAEEFNSVGSVLITAETGALSKKTIIPSMRQRILTVPAKDLLGTKENAKWSLTSDSRCLPGNAVFSVMPVLLGKVNAGAWDKDLLTFYEKYIDRELESGQLRNLNQRFLMIYAHYEVLIAAETMGYISAAQREMYFSRIGKVADWLCQRQEMYCDPFDMARIRLAVEKLSTEVRHIKEIDLCVLNSDVVSDACESCPSFRYYADPTLPRCQYIEKGIEKSELILRPNELGLLIDTDTIETLPQNMETGSKLLIVRRRAFLEQLQEVLEDIDHDYRLAGREYNVRELMTTFREQGLLAYEVRDSEKGQFDYALPWPAANSVLNHSLIMGTSASVLALRLPSNWNIACFEATAHMRLFTEEEIGNPLYLSRMRFKKYVN